MDLLEFIKRRADLQSLMLSAGTVFAGTAAAVIRGNMEILPATVCLLFALFAQLGSNLYHFYAVMRGNKGSSDPISRTPAKINATERAIRMLREGSIGCVIISGMLGLAIISMTSPVWILLIAAAVIFAGAYIMDAYPKVYRSPLSLLVTFIILGPVGVMATAFVQYQYEAPIFSFSTYDSLPSMIIGVTMGFLACSHHIVTSYYYSAIDAVPERPSIIRSCGRGGSRFMVGLFGMLAFVALLLTVFWFGFPRPLLAAIPGFIAFCINTYIAIRLNHAGVGELNFLNTLSLVNFLLAGLLSFVLWWAIGAPDDSMRVLF